MGRFKRYFMKTYLLFPAFNEEGSIQDLLKNIQSALDSAKIQDYEIIVVNDGSRDKTVEKIQSQPVPVTLLDHGRNKGLGQAIRTGLLHIIPQADENDIIVTGEADGTVQTDKFIQLIEAVKKGADLAVATPFIGKGFVNVPLYRRFLSRGANLLYEILFPIDGLHDYTNLARAYRASLLKKTLDYYGDQEFLTLSGFEAVPDIILKLRRFNPRVAEVPIEIDFGQKKKKSSMPVVKTILMSLALCMNHLIGRRV